MPILPSRRGEIRELLERLAAGRPAEQEAAAARLRLLGARVLEALAEWLPAAPAPARLLAARVLEGSPHARALDLLLRLAQDEDAAVAARAVEALAGRPSARGTAALAAVTRRGAGPARRAAAEELARLAEGGDVAALDALLELLLDERQPEELRRAALPAVAALPPRERQPLLERLARGASPGLAAEADRLRGPSRLPAPAALVERLLGAGQGDLERALEAFRGLGLTGAEALGSRLAQGSLGSGQAARLGQALERLGPAALEALRAPLERAGSAEAVAALAEALAASRLPAAVPLLHAALGRLAGETDPARRAAGAAARAALHHALARLDSRAGLYDLRELLACRPLPGPGNLLAAAAAVGDASVARLLVRLAADEPGLVEACREPFAAVVRRERLRRSGRAFKDLSRAEAGALDRLWPAARAARSTAP